MTILAPAPQPLPLVGVGLRTDHVPEVLAAAPAIGWLEVHAENYLADAAALADLLAIRRDTPVALHGVGLSLGGAEPLDRGHLRRLGALARAVEPMLVSEHLAWSTVGGTYLNDLLPLPYTDETLAVVADHVDEAQERLGRRLLVENPSAYLRFAASTIEEADFLATLAGRTGCGILCDVNNLHVRAWNLGEDAERALSRLPAAAVTEIHLAGHGANDIGGRTMLIDDHGGAVAAPVWALYRRAVHRFGAVPTLVEWDTNLPPLATLVAEAAEARRVAVAVLAGGCRDIAA
ncbi:MAG: DUF692 domain-containing protein [Alphaproteobacteria bacterium]|nr:DUF692 domain-containing protein [Alphaproteobacteria bacterium]